MGIKLKLNINFLVILGLLLSFQTKADLVDKIDFTKANKGLANNPEISNKSLTKKNPLKGTNIDFSKIILLNQGNITKANFNEFNIKLSDSNQLSDSKLLSNQYFEIVGNDKKRKLFNGSLIIQFDNKIDLNNFAESNDLILIKNLTDINSGVFKVKNILDVENKINLLIKDNNILSIDLDTIDPTIRPK